MKVDLRKKVGKLSDLTEDEKNLLAAALLFPSLIATLLFLLSPLFA